MIQALRWGDEKVVRLQMQKPSTIQKLLLISTVVLGLAVAHGQTNVYQPFPTDSAVWFYTTYTMSGNDYDYIQWLGDTTINAIAYKKETRKHNSASWTYTGGIRQDIPNEKIYKIYLSGVEQDISISQHLNVGDTLPFYIIPNDTSVIASIDSLQIGTNYHKRYNFTCSDTLCQGNYIVGVGMANLVPPEDIINLACFSVNNINQYGSASSCQLVSTNELTSNNNAISIYPNPFSTQTVLHSDNLLKNATLTVYNSFGQQVKQLKNISGQTITLHRDNLPSGLYFLRLEEDNKTLSADKLLIVNN